MIKILFSFSFSLLSPTFNNQETQRMSFLLFPPGISHQLAAERDWKSKGLRENISTQPKAGLPGQNSGHQSKKKAIKEG